MKKFILLLSTMIFTGLCVNAQQVHYFGGHPSAVRTPSGAYRSINNYGSNAAFAPRTRHINSQRAIADARRRRFERRMAKDRFARPYGYSYDMLRPARLSTPSQVSRFSRDIQISTTSKGHLRNGVIYYD